MAGTMVRQGHTKQHMGEPCDTQGRGSLPSALRDTPVERVPPKGTPTVLGIKTKHATSNPTPRETIHYATTTLGDMSTKGNGSETTGQGVATYKVYPTASSISEEAAAHTVRTQRKVADRQS